MDIIPVIDLKGGAVVHAKQGQRDAYQPIVSRLSATSAPQDVLAGLLRLHPFAKLYIADLDSIQKKGGHSAIIAELAQRQSGLEFWVDAGRAFSAGEPTHGNVHHVLGSESISDIGAAGAALAGTRSILSLDFRGTDFLGPANLLDRPALWPERVIVMTLARVGSSNGPDLERLASIKQRAGTRRVYAAGGVRGRADLQSLRRAGAAGVLVASALHDGRLTPADLA
jgi:phosphoribosylformimino-5-aminoimidazole carboxamide ribotide isomerase